MDSIFIIRIATIDTELNKQEINSMLDFMGRSTEERETRPQTKINLKVDFNQPIFIDKTLGNVPDCNEKINTIINNMLSFSPDRKTHREIRKAVPLFKKARTYFVKNF